MTVNFTPLLLRGEACAPLPPASPECRPSRDSRGDGQCRRARRFPSYRRACPCTKGKPGSQAALDRRRSFSSFLQFGQEPVPKRRIEPRRDGKNPPMRMRGAAQFYRVLLGHHDRLLAAELQIARRERVMVRERVRYRLQAELAEMQEKAVRIANAGHRMNLVPGERARVAAVARIRHAVESLAFERHLESPQGRVPVRDRAINRPEPPRGLAQRP